MSRVNNGALPSLAHSKSDDCLDLGRHKKLTSLSSLCSVASRAGRPRFVTPRQRM